jgi:hypothetical protein
MNLKLIGGIIGFVLFIKNLEGDDMGNILFRLNSDNKPEFRLDNLVSYMGNVFHKWFLWHPELWNCNWLVMAGTGAFAGFVLEKLIM